MIDFKFRNISNCMIVCSVTTNLFKISPILLSFSFCLLSSLIIILATQTHSMASNYIWIGLLDDLAGFTAAFLLNLSSLLNHLL
jgi:hypothetical protein